MPIFDSKTRELEAYIINRADRPQRLAHAREELIKQNLNARVFEAIIDKPGWKGCRDSHLAIMEKCKELGSFLILEDDVLFVNDYYDVMIPAMAELPTDWDCLYLGASPKQPQERYSEHLFRLKNAHVTHGILWHNRKNGAVEYILNYKDEILKIDDFFAREVQPNFNCFVVYPILATQAEFKSDTCHRSDVSTIITNYQKYCI